METNNKLYRKRDGQVVAGVCNGLADKYGWDVGTTRLITVLLAIFVNFPFVIVYIVMALVLPDYETIQEKTVKDHGHKKDDYYYDPDEFEIDEDDY